MKIFIKIFLIIILFSGSTYLRAQSLVISQQDKNFCFDNKELQNLPLNSIRGIKFGNNTMIIKMLNGTSFTYNIDKSTEKNLCEITCNNLLHFYFDIPTNSQAKLDDISITNGLNIYPVPSENFVNLELLVEEKTYVIIDIIDVYGNKIDEIFKGDHQGKQTYQWSSDRPNGIYYCRILTKKNIFIKPIIIK